MSDSRFDKDPRDKSQHEARQEDVRAHDARGLERTPSDLRYENVTLERMSDGLIGKNGIARFLGNQC